MMSSICTETKMNRVSRSPPIPLRVALGRLSPNQNAVKFALVCTKTVSSPRAVLHITNVKQPRRRPITDLLVGCTATSGDRERVHWKLNGFGAQGSSGYLPITYPTEHRTTHHYPGAIPKKVSSQLCTCIR